MGAAAPLRDSDNLRGFDEDAWDDLLNYIEEAMQAGHQAREP